MYIYFYQLISLKREKISVYTKFLISNANNIVSILLYHGVTNYNNNYHNICLVINDLDVPQVLIGFRCPSGCPQILPQLSRTFKSLYNFPHIMKLLNIL